MRRILCRFFHWCLLMLEDPAEMFRGCWVTAPTTSQPPQARTLARQGSRVLVGVGTHVFIVDMDGPTLVRPVEKL